MTTNCEQASAPFDADKQQEDRGAGREGGGKGSPGPDYILLSIVMAHAAVTNKEPTTVPPNNEPASSSERERENGRGDDLSAYAQRQQRPLPPTAEPKPKTHTNTHKTYAEYLL